MWLEYEFFHSRKNKWIPVVQFIWITVCYHGILIPEHLLWKSMFTPTIRMEYVRFRHIHGWVELSFTYVYGNQMHNKSKNQDYRRLCQAKCTINRKTRFIGDKLSFSSIILVFRFIVQMACQYMARMSNKFEKLGSSIDKIGLNR